MIYGGYIFGANVISYIPQYIQHLAMIIYHDKKTLFHKEKKRTSLHALKKRRSETTSLHQLTNQLSKVNFRDTNVP